MKCHPALLALLILLCPGAYGTAEDPILAAEITELRPLPHFGDLWPSTWASDDNLYFAWGDGTGQGACYPVPADATACRTLSECAQGDVFCGLFCGAFPCDGITCYPPCRVTQAGLLRVESGVASFTGCAPECIRSVDIPTGIPRYNGGARNDKASSLLFTDGVLYWAGHEPPYVPAMGYIAYSTDLGETWTEVPGTPWTGNSNFRILMFFNMGKDYGLNTDGFVYGLGVGAELHLPPVNQEVFLLRTPTNAIANYAHYQYFVGVDESGEATWSSDQSAAVALDGLATAATGAAMYHEGVERFVFLGLPIADDELTLTLYEAPHPWGPWRVAQAFPGHYYIPGIIAKDAGPTSFYFTAAGGSVSYQMHIGKMEVLAAGPGEQIPVSTTAAALAAALVGVIGLNRLRPSRQP